MALGIDSAIVAEGGRVTNSPPQKVKVLVEKEIKYLASGIDSLVLSIDIGWNNNNLFKTLSEMKEQAKENETDQYGVMESNVKDDVWLYNLRHFGSKGYEWILNSNEFNMRVGNWDKPKSRPSVIVEISSETLWKNGPLESYKRLLRLLESNGAQIVEVKISRVDLCVDVLLSEDIWKMNLLEYKVTRAKKSFLAFKYSELETIRIGTGKILARLYDKDTEIRDHSHKYWMFVGKGVKSLFDLSRLFSQFLCNAFAIVDFS